MKPRKRVAFHTLGCKLNFAETSHIARTLPQKSFEIVGADEKADAYIINTCSVTDAADRKCRQAIKKFIRQSPGAFIAVVGCYSQLKPQEIASIPGVDLVLGSGEKFDLAGFLEGFKKKNSPEVYTGPVTDDEIFHPSWSAGDRTRSFLKIQDGCDYGCAYCTIPLARGKSRNAPVRMIAEEAEKIAASGVKEIVLTGVNTGDFGRSTGESFLALIETLDSLDGIERIRLSSIEPNLLDDCLIDLVSASKKILPHFHIPLQSGCNKILRLMRRRYVREVFLERVAKIRDKMPLAGIGADVIAGFPGETDADFKETFRFLEDAPVSYLHVFAYSDRPGTPAESMPLKVAPPVRETRSRALALLSADKHLSFCRQNSGESAQVLFEYPGREDKISGFTGNYIRVEHHRDEKLSGQIRKVILKDITESGNMTCEIEETI